MCPRCTEGSRQAHQEGSHHHPPVVTDGHPNHCVYSHPDHRTHSHPNCSTHSHPNCSTHSYSNCSAHSHPNHRVHGRGKTNDCPDRYFRPSCLERTDLGGVSSVVGVESGSDRAVRLPRLVVFFPR